MNDADAGHIAPTLEKAAWDRISQVRDEFERAWQAGTVPSIDDFLARNSNHGPEVDADRPSQDSYLKRFSSPVPTLRDGLLQVEAELDSWRQKTMVGESSDGAAAGGDIIDAGGLVVPQEPPIPQSIGRYLVERKLAEG